MIHVSGTLLEFLDADERRDLEDIAGRYRFSHSQLRIAAEMARDLSMWGEPKFASLWRRFELEAEPRLDSPARRTKILKSMGLFLDRCRDGDKLYSGIGNVRGASVNIGLEERERGGRIIGRCPATSATTTCCGLHTIDAVLGCPYRCSYCAVQTFHRGRAQLTGNLELKLREAADLTAREDIFHLGTGQSSDALAWGSVGGLLDALLRFASSTPQSIVELKTKSARIEPLLCRKEIPPNVVCSWTLSSQRSILHEERGTARLDERLRAARAACDAGLKIAFHFHPIIRYQNWKEDYVDLVGCILSMFRAEEILYCSFGSLTFSRTVLREIRRRGGKNNILRTRLEADSSGKLVLPSNLRVDIYRFAHRLFSPWHGKVFFYLCMETREIWQRAFGYSYSDSDALAKAMRDHIKGTLQEIYPQFCSA